MRRAWLLVVLLLIAALAGAVEVLRIEEVRVSGISSLPAQAIVRASGLQVGDRILWERLTAAERRIEQIPAVAQATAERVLPGTVVLHVRERVPIARLDSAPQLVVDRSGYVFEAGEREVPAVLYGWKPPGNGAIRPGVVLDRTSRIVLDAFPAFPQILQDRARRLRVGRTFELTLAFGVEVRFGVLRDLETKAAVAEAVLRKESGKKLAYIDVRSPSFPVSRERSAATPSPSPGGTAVITPTPAV